MNNGKEQNLLEPQSIVEALEAWIMAESELTEKCGPSRDTPCEDREFNPGLLDEPFSI